MRANRKVRGMAISLQRPPYRLASESWWIGKSRDEFKEAAKQEQPRMREARLYTRSSE